MASRDESVSLQSDLSITSFEDVERILLENNIVQQYHGHLKQVNIRILMFEELETNRSYWEMFSDWANGGRDKITRRNLVKYLKELKEELLAGISIYTKLLAQKEELEKHFQNMKMMNFENIVVEKGMPNNFVINDATNQILLGNGFEVSRTKINVIVRRVITMAVGLLLIQTTNNWGIAGIGILCMIGLVLIYKFAKYKGKERFLKYQDVEKSQDNLNGRLLDEIRVKNDHLKKMYQAIDKRLHKKDVILYLANSFYSESKDEALKEITDDEPDITAELCETLSKREAKISCKSYLKREFNCLNEEAEEILSEIQSSRE